MERDYEFRTVIRARDLPDPAEIGRAAAEEVIGQVIRELDVRDDMFIATTVTTPETRDEGIASLEACMNALGVDRVSAMRAHSISGAEILFPIFREWKEAGRIKYFGDTTMNAEEYPELERQLREENMDIIEIEGEGALGDFPRDGAETQMRPASL